MQSCACRALCTYSVIAIGATMWVYHVLVVCSHSVDAHAVDIVVHTAQMRTWSSLTIDACSALCCAHSKIMCMCYTLNMLRMWCNRWQVCAWAAFCIAWYTHCAIICKCCTQYVRVAYSAYYTSTLPSPADPPQSQCLPTPYKSYSYFLLLL